MGDDPGRARVARMQSQVSRRGGCDTAVEGRPGDAEAEAGVMLPLAEGLLGPPGAGGGGDGCSPRAHLALRPVELLAAFWERTHRRSSEPPRLWSFVVAESGQNAPHL